MSDDSNASPWKDRAIWSRVVFVVLFLLVFSLIVGPLAIIIGVAQSVFTIFTGEGNRNLRGLAATLAEYAREILLFTAWSAGRKPFPFSEFPNSGELEDAAPVGDAETEAEVPDAESASATATEAEASASGQDEPVSEPASTVEDGSAEETPSESEPDIGDELANASESAKAAAPAGRAKKATRKRTSSGKAANTTRKKASSGKAARNESEN